MILDDIRARYPQIGLAVYAIDPGGPVTVEAYMNGQVFPFAAATAVEALALAFPEMMAPAADEPTESAESVFD